MSKKKKPSAVPAKKSSALQPATGTLLADIRELITTARGATAQAVNSALVLLHWQVGTRVRSEVLKESRARYGEQIVSTLSRELAAEFGQGFSEKALWRMIHTSYAVSPLGRV